jgi:toxin ParE1/3/4
MGYRVTRQAKEDLAQIYAYCEEQASPETADRMIDSIMERFSMLSDFPEAGRLSEQFGVGVRCFPAGCYLIYYRRSRRSIDILHVFHGAREQQRAFRKAN